MKKNVLEIVANCGRSYKISLSGLWYSNICETSDNQFSLWLEYIDGRKIDFRNIQGISKDEIENVIKESLNEY